MAARERSLMATLDRLPGGRQGVGVGVLLLLAIPLIRLGYEAAFGNWGALDDEGYILIGLREFADGHSLYDEIYSQYGPGLFVLVGGALSPFDLLTTDGAKWVQLAFWIAASLLTGVALLRLTDNLPIATAGLGVAFFVLAVNAGEPLHPGALICLLLISIVVAAAYLVPWRPATAMAAIGALCAVIISLKVNIGGLALASVICALGMTLPREDRYRLARLAACLALVSLPVWLTLTDLDQTWARRYAVVVAIGALSVALVATRLPAAGLAPGRQLRALLLGVAAVLLFVVAVVVATGTSISGLIRGVVLDPLELNDIVLIPLGVDPLAPLWGIAWVAMAFLVRGGLLGEHDEKGWRRAAFAAVRLGVGLLIWVSLAHAPGLPALPKNIWIGAPLIWLATVPRRETEPAESFVRALIASLAVLQLLHAYPVAGSQVGWSEFLLVPIGGLCIADGARELARVGPSLLPGIPGWTRLAGVAVGCFAIWFCLVPLRQYYDTVHTRFEDGLPLGLGGAQRLRLNPAQTLQLRTVAADLDSRCDGFISLPGINSLYPWTGTDPPTSLNAGAWPWLLDSEQQQHIVEEVEGNENLCVVRSPFMLNFWSQAFGAAPDRPLVRFIRRDFTVARAYPGFPFQALELLERRRP